MGRPSITGESIVVVIDDVVLAWTDGHLSGTDRESIKKAKFLSKYGLDVDLSPFGPTVPAGLDDVSAPERATAAMVGVNPGRARIVQAPDSVLNLLPFEQDNSIDFQEDEFMSVEELTALDWVEELKEIEAEKSDEQSPKVSGS